MTRLAHFNLQLKNSCHDQTFQNLIFLLNVAFFTRYEFVSSNLEKSERERLFDEHIDLLVAKKKDNFRKMLDEQKRMKKAKQRSTTGKPAAFSIEES